MPNTTHTQTVIITGTLYTVDYVATQTDELTYHDITLSVIHPFSGVTRELHTVCLLYASEYTRGIDSVELPITVLFDKYDRAQRDVFYYKLFCARLIRAYHNGTDMRVASLV